MAKIHSSVLYKSNLTTYSQQAQLAHWQSVRLASYRSQVLILLMTYFFFILNKTKTLKTVEFALKTCLKQHLFKCHFYSCFVVFYQNYIFLLQVVFQCKNYSKITVETRTQFKSVIFTTDIFAVQPTVKLRAVDQCTIQF